VAEAIARTRSVDENISARTHAVPTRRAPAPPVPKERTQELHRSQVASLTPVPKERTQEPQNISAFKQGTTNANYNHGESVKNFNQVGGNYVYSVESARLYVGKRVTQSSKNDWHRKGAFENRVNGNFSSDESARRGLEEFRNVHHSVVPGNNSNHGGFNGQLQSGNPSVIGDNSTVLEIKSESYISDLGLQERIEGKLCNAEENCKTPVATHLVKPDERLLILKSKAEEASQVVSHVTTTKPQDQETVTFPQRNEETITEETESNDHRRQTRTSQEVQNHSRSQNTAGFNGSDEYVKTATSEQEEITRANKATKVMKQNLVIEDKQQKTRHSPHILPTGQHKHDSSYTSSSRTRNTVLLIDNSQSKRENFPPVAQQQSADKDLVINGIVASSCSPLVENLIVELQESSQHRTQLQHRNNKNNGDKQIQNVRENGVNGSRNNSNEFIESLYKKSLQPRIQHSDWFEVDNGKPIRYSSCHITLDDSYPASSDSSNTDSNSSTIELSRSNSFQYTDYSELSVDVNLDCRAQLISQRHHVSCNRRRNMASLQGLPPLPKSLSGINLFESCAGNLHFTPVDQQQQKPEVLTPRGMTKSGSFRQIAQQSSGNGGGVPGVGSSSGAVRVVPSSSGRGPTPPTPGGTSHQQILHHQLVRGHHQNGDVQPPLIAPRMRKPTGLDAQLAILRKEMVS
jgi:hypothetical protein